MNDNLSKEILVNGLNRDIQLRDNIYLSNLIGHKSLLEGQIQLFKEAFRLEIETGPEYNNYQHTLYFLKEALKRIEQQIEIYDSN